MQTIRVHRLPAHVDPADLAGRVVVVIDLLRASSTICQALASGATCVMPFLEVEEALRAARQFPRGAVVLGGERHGKIIEGFDLGNSPLEYTPEIVGGRRVLFTTTNGTRALYHAPAAKRVLIGCALNRRAIANCLVGEPQVDILCAGTDGEITGEDILAAGAITASLTDFGRSAIWELKQSATSALQNWESLLSSAAYAPSTASEQFAISVRHTPGGMNLLDIGHHRDLIACTELDVLDIVPELDRQTGEIRPA